MNVLSEVTKEDTQEFYYPDEKIASNIYQVSLSHALRALAGMEETEKLEKEKANSWLECETEKVHSVPVLDFDNIVGKLQSGSGEIISSILTEKRVIV